MFGQLQRRRSPFTGLTVSVRLQVPTWALQLQRGRHLHALLVRACCSRERALLAILALQVAPYGSLNTLLSSQILCPSPPGTQPTQPDSLPAGKYFCLGHRAFIFASYDCNQTKTGQVSVNIMQTDGASTDVNLACLHFFCNKIMKCVNSLCP